jgi:hypothetical protein
MNGPKTSNGVKQMMPFDAAGTAIWGGTSLSTSEDLVPKMPSSTEATWSCSRSYIRARPWDQDLQCCNFTCSMSINQEYLILTASVVKRNEHMLELSFWDRFRIGVIRDFYLDY